MFLMANKFFADNLHEEGEQVQKGPSEWTIVVEILSGSHETMW